MLAEEYVWFRRRVFASLLPAVFLVLISYMGFFIAPSATPARMTLGVITVLTMMVNMQTLLRVLPPTVKQPWLVRFLMSCLIFNVSALIELVRLSRDSHRGLWR
jgi:hypothetical protein